MKSKKCLFTGLIVLVSLVAACSSTLASVSETTETTVTPSPTLSPDLPYALPTQGAPDAVGINPDGLLGNVYISSKDRLYHRPDCTKLGSKSTAISKTQAKIEGYSACPVCKP